MQCACAVFYYHVWPIRLYSIFQHYLINETIFERKKITEHKIYILIFSTTLFWNIPHSKKKWAIYIWSTMHIDLHVQYQLLLSDFNETWIFSIDFREILKYQTSWKAVYWGPSCSMRTDERTNRHDDANSRFPRFYESAWTLN